jgi:membrane fusion protein, multidrug efflux system
MNCNFSIERFFCAVVLFFSINPSHAQSPALQKEKPVDVIVQAVSVLNLNTKIEALGSLQANESILLTPNLSKKVTRINFDDGQRVVKGQVLVEMTSREESALLQEALFNAEEAKKQLDRVAALVKRGAASESLLDQRTREYEAANARFDATESRLKDLILVAPFSGVVGLRQVSVGALVSPGVAITTLNDDSKMKLDFTVPAIHLRHLSVGLTVVATSRDLGDKKMEGKVVSIDNNIDEITRAIKMRALIDNKNHELKQGMLMSVDLRANDRTALVVSEAALMPFGGDNFVFIVKQDAEITRVERRAVVIGQRLPGMVEIISGLNLKEKYVTHGLQKIRHDQVVNIISEEPVIDHLSQPSDYEPVHLSDLLKQQKDSSTQ